MYDLKSKAPDLQKKLECFYLFALIAISAVLLFFAIYFRVERLSGDSAYYLFKIINDSAFVIEHGRPISVAIEFLPLILVKLNAPLSLIITAFSINEFLYFTLFSFLFWFFLKDRVAALANISCYLIGVLFNYYNPVSELILSIPLFFLFIHLSNKIVLLQKRGISHRAVSLYLTFMLLIFLILRNHPLNIVIVPLLLCCSFLSKPASLRSRLRLLVLFVIPTLFFVVLMKLDMYERGQLNSSGGFRNQVMQFPLNAFMLDLQEYRIPQLLLFACIVIGLIILKEYKPLLLFVTLIAVYAFIILVTAGSKLHIIEPFERFMIFIPLIICYFFFDKITFSSLYKPAALVFTLAVILKIAPLFSIGEKLKQRNQYIENLIRKSAKLEVYKLAIPHKNIHLPGIPTDWILCCESMLMTTIYTGKTKQLYVIESMGMPFVADNEYFYSPWWQKDTSTLNRTYFNFQGSKTLVINADSIVNSP